MMILVKGCVKMTYDYLIVGAGLFGSVFAREAHKQGKKVLVIDKRDHIGGSVYTKEMKGIHVHFYGAHIFHTSDQTVWDYVNQFSSFNNYVNSPLANYQGKLYNLPFNMNTFYQLWGVTTPREAMEKIKEQQAIKYTKEPKNLEEQAINLVGPEIYEKLIKGYTEKQWGTSCDKLPAFIIKRLPVRFTFDNNYFNDTYQGIPIGGYTKMVEGILEGIEVRLNSDYLLNRQAYDKLAKKVIYTGPIDAFYDYAYGVLNYRSLRFDHEILDLENFQGNAVINYTEKKVPYTRIIEHKHFEFGTQSQTVITKEYPQDWKVGMDAYYPINDEANQEIYMKYKKHADQETTYIFGGRLAEYKYYNMDQVIKSALICATKELK